MKRLYALVAVAVVVAGLFVGQRILDDDGPAPAASDPSRSFDPDEALAAEGEEQARQMQEALDELSKDAAAASTPHTLIVTIRDDLPLEVWDATCHLDQGPGAPTLGVLNEKYKPIVDEVALPSAAKLLANGACEATVSVAVPNFAAYHVGVVIEGRGISDGNEPPPVERLGKSQHVTVVE